MRAILIILFFSLSAFADSNIKLKYGVGVDSVKILDDTYRAIELGYYTDVEKSISWAVTAGYYGDKSIDLDTGFACAQFGVELNPFGFMYVDNYFGPCYLHESGGALSGNLQFATNTGIGWRDKTGSQMGINLKHFSNAGLSKPNMGTNLLMLNMSFGL